MGKKNQIKKEEKKGRSLVFLLGFAVIIAIIFFFLYFILEKFGIIPIPQLTEFYGFTIAETGIVFVIGFILVLFAALTMIEFIKGGKKHGI